MNTFMRSSGTLCLVAGLLATGACDDSAGPGGVGQASVVLTSDAPAASRAPADVRLSVGDVPAAALGSLLLDVTRIDVHVAGLADDGLSGEGGEPADDDAGWITLELSLAAPVDLLDLTATSPVELASGAIPAGRITQVRLFFDTAQLTLDTDVDVPGQTLPAGVYDVRVPSAEQTGLKIGQFDVTVEDGETGTVALELDLDASIGSLVYSANGFQLSPVLRVG